MRFHGIGPIRKAQIRRKVFAEIGHPAHDAVVQHLSADNALRKPCSGFFPREIEHAAIELTEIDEMRLVGVAGEAKVATRPCFCKQFAINRQIGVNVCEKADTLFGEVSDALLEVGVSLLTARTELPVPEQAPTETRLPDAGPILAPQS